MPNTKFPVTRSHIAVFNAGGRAQRRGIPRKSPYSRDGTYNEAWLAGWDKAEVRPNWDVPDPSNGSVFVRLKKPKTFSKAFPKDTCLLLIPQSDGSWKMSRGMCLAHAEETLLRLMLKGLSVPKAAKEMSLHKATVEMRVTVLKRRFGCDSQLALLETLRSVLKEVKT